MAITFGIYVKKKKNNNMTMKFTGVHIFIGAVVLSVVASIITGFLIVGTPKDERARSLDAQRVNDLQQIASAIDVLAWNSAEKIPATLDELVTKRDVYVTSIVDPETQIPYEYTVKSEKDFELCATFSLPSTYQQSDTSYPVPMSQRIWDHAIGRTCFSLTVTSNKVK